MGRPSGKPARRIARPRLSLADRADPRALYQRAVQAPSADVSFIDAVYRRERHRVPLVLREDFCGTAYLSATWALSHRRRRAIGVDLDAETLAWGREHNLAPRRLERRVHLLQGDVRHTPSRAADVTCAMNFSFCALKSRADLLGYFRQVHAGLAPSGMFVAEHYGGTEAVVAARERRAVGQVTYVWEQESFNPVTSETRCSIHFEFRDGSRLARAFRYDWRLWSIPEIRELLAEAGFARSDVYWDHSEADGKDDVLGSYRLTTEVENQECWLVYLVAFR